MWVFGGVGGTWIWIILFDCEVEHIWRREWNIVKILYLSSQYGPLVDVPINLASESGLVVVYRWDVGNTDRVSGSF